jgi:hypothetical protein
LDKGDFRGVLVNEAELLGPAQFPKGFVHKECNRCNLAEKISSKRTGR